MAIAGQNRCGATHVGLGGRVQVVADSQPAGAAGAAVCHRQRLQRHRQRRRDAGTPPRLPCTTHRRRDLPAAVPLRRLPRRLRHTVLRPSAPAARPRQRLSRLRCAQRPGARVCRRGGDAAAVRGAVAVV